MYRSEIEVRAWCERHLRGVYEQSGQLMALCPLHRDNTPSLSIDPEDCVAHCFAGCEFGGTLRGLAEAAGLPTEDLLRPRDDYGPIEAEYVYRDAQGRPYHLVRRYQGKVFRPFRLAADGTWERQSGLDGQPRIPYRLDELTHADPSAPILWVEGEKDAETARRLGMLSTTTPFGTGGGLRGLDEQAWSVVRGREVWVIPDRDDAGRRHAVKLRFRLQAAQARVYVLELPGPGKDLTDWVGAGGTPDQLRELMAQARSAPNPEPEPEGPPPPLRVVRWAELAACDVEQRYLVGGLLPVGGTSLFHAPPKCGKSTSVRSLAVCVAQGLPWLGRDTAQGGVLVLALEESEAQVRGHFLALGANLGDPLFVHVGPAVPPLDRCPEYVSGLVDEHGLVLAILDTAGRILDLGDLNDYQDVTRAMAPWTEIATRTGVHIMLVHHSGKSADRDESSAALGSTALPGAVDTILHLRSKGGVRILSSVQRTGEPLDNVELEIDQDRRVYLVGQRPRQDPILAYLDAHPDSTAQEVAAGVGEREGDVRGRLRTLGAAGGPLLESGRGVKGNPKRYRLRDNPQPDEPHNHAPAENQQELFSRPDPGRESNDDETDGVTMPDYSRPDHPNETLDDPGTTDSRPEILAPLRGGKASIRAAGRDRSWEAGLCVDCRTRLSPRSHNDRCPDCIFARARTLINAKE